MIALATVLLAEILASATLTRFLWDTEDGPVRTVGMIGSVDESVVRQHALRTLSPSKIRVGWLVVYSSLEDRFKSGAWGPKEGPYYEGWLHDVQRFGLVANPPRCPDLTEAIKIGDSVVLRKLDSRCQVRQTMIQGTTNPLHIQLSGTKYEVLGLVIQPDFEGKRSAKLKLSPIHLYVRTEQPVTTDRARQVLDHILRTTTAPDVTVVLRNDQWFLSATEYTVLFLFGGVPPSIPSKEEFSKTKQVVCGSLHSQQEQCY